MIPIKQRLNQLEFVDNLVKVFLTAYGDEAMNATKSYGLGLILESVMARHEMIAMDIVQEWLTTNENEKGKGEAVKQIKTFIELQSADAEEESESDSDY